MDEAKTYEDEIAEAAKAEIEAERRKECVEAYK